jgi:hypothetical protein
MVMSLSVIHAYSQSPGILDRSTDLRVKFKVLSRNNRKASMVLGGLLYVWCAPLKILSELDSSPTIPRINAAIDDITASRHASLACRRLGLSQGSRCR